jgi:hypothetical protein
VTLPPAAGIELGAMLRRLQDAAGVKLYCQESLGRTPVAVVLLRERPASEIMRGLATVCAARWVRVRDGYVLCRTPEVAPLIPLDSGEVWKRTAEGVREAVASLTPEQLAVLRQGEKLPFGRLTPGQQRRVAEFTAGFFLRAGEQWCNPLALRGQGVFLQVEEGGKLGLMVPDAYHMPSSIISVPL